MVQLPKFMRQIDENTIQVRWLARHEVEVYVRGEQRLCAGRPDCGPDSISWEHMLFDWDLSDVKSTIRRIRRSARRMYVGVSSSPSWRWSSCAGHKVSDDAEPMRAHRDRFDLMFPVCAEHGGVIEALEEMMYELMWEEFPSIVCNSRIYRPGVIEEGGVYFLYICVIV